MVSDPLGDLLTQIRNGYLVSHQEVKLPYSKLKERLAAILVQEGFLKSQTLEKENQPILVLGLKYRGKKPAVVQVKRISKPGRRIYLPAKKIKPLLSGLGVRIISTPVGFLTDKQARRKNLGGEVICQIW